MPKQTSTAKDSEFAHFWRWVIAIAILSQALFLLWIQFPKTVNFDEFHYVPAAKEMLTLGENRNWEHPPLGKLILAAGIATFGDRPLGWRFMSTVFGAWTLAAVFALALTLFRTRRSALWVTALTFVNGLLYVQARIGMLDTFMLCFVLWGIYAFLHKNRWATGVLLGLAVCCKWYAVFPLITVLGLGLFSVWRAEPLLVRLKHALLIGIVAVFFYYLPFAIFLWMPQHQSVSLGARIWEILYDMQLAMWDGQQRVVSHHPYNSTYLEWPLLTRPIWYAFDREPGGFVRGVLLLGTPLYMIAGLAALVLCVWDWLNNLGKSHSSALITVFFGVFYGAWVIIPRKVSFFYYYYPAGMLLGLALYRAFELIEKDHPQSAWMKWVFLSAVAGMFVYFFPIFAGLSIPVESFRQWMWLPRWI